MQTTVRDFFKYLFFFFCFFVLENAQPFGAIAPFASGLALALIWCKQKPHFVLPLYALSACIIDFSTATIISVLWFGLSLSICLALHTKLKKPISFTVFCVYCAISLLGFIFTEIYFFQNTLFCLLSASSTMLFMWSAKTIFGAVLLQENRLAFRPAQKLSALVVLGLLACGLEAITIFGVPLLKLTAPIIILLLGTTQKTETTVLVSAVMGVGASLVCGNPATTACLVVWALCVSAVKGVHRIFPAIALIGAEAFCGYAIGFVGGYNYVHLIVCVVGVVGFLLLPITACNKFAQIFQPQNIAERSIANRSREALHKRLFSLSEVFSEMDYIFRSMTKNGLSMDQIKTLLVSELKSSVCYDCPERNICHRKCVETTYSVLENLINSALVRGKTSLLDTPPYLTKRCSRISSLVAEINSLSAKYRQYATAMQSIDISRVLIADELKGLAQILRSLANEVNKNITFDADRENKIISELAFYNIICKDAVVYEENLLTTSVTLLVKKTDSLNPKIAEVVSKITKTKVAISSVNTSAEAGWNILTLKTAPKYSIAFGTACKTKEGSKVSGDAYSIIKLAHDKYLMALCDGMGSGEKAEKTASLAIGLVENFYKAGFDNDIILSSINKLLSMSSDDVFSALDICVIDTHSGGADFIKMGAPESFVKHKETIEAVEATALPLGIVQEAEASVFKHLVSSGDFVIMLTDGIADSFETLEKLKDFLNNLQSLNPQTLAENILSQALYNSGGAKDDMTVIVAKIFKNN